MLFTYKMTSATIGRVKETNAAGQRNSNAGDYYVVARIKNTKNPRAKDTAIVVFERDDKAFVDAVRSVFPTGNDANNQPYNGSNTTIAAGSFDMATAMQQLENVGGENFRIFPDAKNMDFPLPGKYVMTYATALNGANAGDPVKEKNSGFVKIVTKVKLFVMMYDEAADQYVEGYGPEDRLNSRMNNLIALEKFIEKPENKAMVNPRDLNESAPSVPQDAGASSEDDYV